MRIQSLPALLVFLITSVLAAPPPFVPIKRSDGPVIPNGYIIRYKDGTVDSVKPHHQIIHEFSPKDAQVRYEYFNGIAGTFSDDAIREFQSSPIVQSIELDTIGGVDKIIYQEDAPWGLQRISQTEPLDEYSSASALDFTYSYDSIAGRGVDVYVVDTGINTNHTEFEGRAIWGITFGNYTPDVDGFGHGTHVAGIVGSRRYGVAKKANLIAVRVLSSNGDGALSDCIAGVEWATSRALKTRRPSVITISLRYSPSDALDATVTDSINAGVHVIASAGNAGTSSTTQSPGRAPAVVTVGATDIKDSMALFSNFGPGVDIFAPGTNIISTYIGASNDVTKAMTGTSMATPHVAGLFAYMLSKWGSMSTAAMLSLIKQFSPDNILKNIPPDTNDELINNGIRYDYPPSVSRSTFLPTRTYDRPSSTTDEHYPPERPTPRPNPRSI